MSAYYNDNDAYCCRVLRKNIAAGHLPPGDVDERDIRDVQPDDLAGYRAIHLFAGIGGLALASRMAGLDDNVSLCTGGFPCQDISIAGRGAGIDGKHSGLWREMVRLLGAVRPGYVLVENSTALLGRGLGRVLGDLAACGYDAQWDCISAASVGAPHIRDRVFILAYPERAQRQPAAGERIADRQDSTGKEATDRPATRGQAGGAGILADADGQRCAQQRRTGPGPASDAGPERGRGDISHTHGGRYGASTDEIRSGRSRPEHSNWWSTEPPVGRMAHGLPHRVDRLRGLGNAVVPQAAAVALRAIAAMEAEVVAS